MSYVKLTDFAAKDALLSGNPSKLLRGTEIGAELDAIESAMAAAEAVNITAPVIAASTSKTTPVDADVLPILDSAASNILKKVTWANVKATLKTYFDTLYAATGSFAASGANNDITSLSALTAGGLPNNSVLTADIADANVTPAKLSQPFTAGTAVATTSGTSIDFTGLPSWVKRITVMLNKVSLAGTAELLLQVGSGSVDATSTYFGSVTNHNGSSGSAFTTGAILTYAGSPGSANVGQIVLTHMGGNVWTIIGILQWTSGSSGSRCAGVKSLSGALDRIRLTSIGGTDTFDDGSVNILYE